MEKRNYITDIKKEKKCLNLVNGIESLIFSDYKYWHEYDAQIKQTKTGKKRAKWVN